MSPRKLEILKFVNEVGLAPPNFIYARDGGNQQNIKVALKELTDDGYFTRPPQQNARWNALAAFKVYAVAPKGFAILKEIGIDPIPWAERQFWHQLMISHIVSSFELIARDHNLAFRSRRDLIGDLPLSLSCTISHEGQEWGHAVYPDALFALNDKFFAVEADRNQENIWRPDFKTSSYRRKLLQYAEVFKNRTYTDEWHLPSIFVLNVTTSQSHSRNIAEFMETELEAKSRGMLFIGLPILGSHTKSPQPLMHLWDDPWQRVGHPPISIKEIVNGG